jgi:hypothetical protein
MDAGLAGGNDSRRRSSIHRLRRDHRGAPANFRTHLQIGAQVTTWKGAGSTDGAASFVCAAEKQLPEIVAVSTIPEPYGFDSAIGSRT